MRRIPPSRVDFPSLQTFDVALPYIVTETIVTGEGGQEEKQGGAEGEEQREEEGEGVV
ncbi:unnamed protein product, partial [Closterium sp. NIES-54]